jgi:hypothetical protein
VTAGFGSGFPSGFAASDFASDVATAAGSATFSDTGAGLSGNSASLTADLLQPAHARGTTSRKPRNHNFRNRFIKTET